MNLVRLSIVCQDKVCHCGGYALAFGGVGLAEGLDLGDGG